MVALSRDTTFGHSSSVEQQASKFISMLTLPRLLPSLQASTSRLPAQASYFSTSSAALKMKTHQGAAKRFKATAKGLVSAVDTVKDGTNLTVQTCKLELHGFVVMNVED
jgi:hypothetical protein